MKRKLLTIVFVSLIAILPIMAQHKITISDDIDAIKLSDDVYLYRSYFQTQSFGKVGGNGLILIKNDEALMIDTPWNNRQTEEIFNWIQDSLRATVKTLIVTHWHDDCMGGLEYLKTKGVDSYANQMTIDIAKDKGLSVPQQGFVDSLEIDFQDIPVECYYLGRGHSTDNIVVWLPTEDILFGGCCIKDMSSKDLGNLADADVKAWPSTIRKITKKFSKVKIIVPGHGAIGGSELMQHTQQLLKK